jgi:hypothetical protein
MQKKNQAVRLFEMPEGSTEDPPIHSVYARTLSLLPRMRYPMAEAAWLLGISERLLQYRVAAEEIHPVYEGDKPLFMYQELQRYAVQNHASLPRKTKQQVERSTPAQP